MTDLTEFPRAGESIVQLGIGTSAFSALSANEIRKLPNGQGESCGGEVSVCTEVLGSWKC